MEENTIEKDNELITNPNTFKITKWNKKIEKVVRDIGNKSLKYKSLHLKVAKKANKNYSYYMKSIIILTPLAGTIGAIGASINDYSWIFGITSSIITFISAILVSMIKFGKYDQTFNAHKTATARYISLGNNVKRQLSLYRKDRIPASQYLNWLTHSFDELYISAPILDNIEEFDKIEDEILLEDNDIDEIDEIEEQNNFLKIKIKDNDDNIKLDDINTGKKNNQFLSIQDLNTYDDGLMSYQLNRLNNL